MKTSIKKLLTAFTLLVIAASCASPPKLPIASELDPSEEGPAGYTKTSQEGVYESPALRISARQIRSGDGVYGNGETGFINTLADSGHILIRLTIENNTRESKVLFNPAYVALTDNAFTYKKPLDYTDLYDIVKEKDETGSSLTGVKGRIFDLTATIGPGGKTSKLLIFTPFIEEPSQADLVIKDIYVGKETVSLSFPFGVKTVEKKTPVAGQ